jgi:hypothetical protein
MPSIYTRCRAEAILKRPAERLGIEAKARFTQTHKEVVEKELALAD